MAVPNAGQRVASNWVTVVKTKPEDQINKDYWLFDRFSKGEGFVGKSGGDFIVQPIEYALNGTVSSYADIDTISTTRYDVFDRYEVQWKEYAGTYVLSDLEDDRNQGDGQVFDLRNAKLQNLYNSLRSTFNTDMFGDGSGNNSKVFSGLQLLVSVTPTTGVVQAVDRSVNSFARNQQTSGAQTASAFDNLRATMRSIYNLSSNGISGDHPTFGVCPRNVFEGFEGLLIANERFVKKGNGEGAFETLTFKGAELSFDLACPAANLYWLNEKFLKMVYKTGSWMKPQPAIRPVNQTADFVIIRTMANLVAVNPRRLGVVSSIS